MQCILRAVNHFIRRHSIIYCNAIHGFFSWFFFLLSLSSLCCTFKRMSTCLTLYFQRETLRGSMQQTIFRLHCDIRSLQHTIITAHSLTVCCIEKLKVFHFETERKKKKKGSSGYGQLRKFRMQHRFREWRARNLHLCTGIRFKVYFFFKATTCSNIHLLLNGRVVNQIDHLSTWFLIRRFITQVKRIQREQQSKKKKKKKEVTKLPAQEKESLHSTTSEGRSRVSGWKTPYCTHSPTACIRWRGQCFFLSVGWYSWL